MHNYTSKEDRLVGRINLHQHVILVGLMDYQTQGSTREKRRTDLNVDVF